MGKVLDNPDGIHGVEDSHDVGCLAVGKPEVVDSPNKADSLVADHIHAEAEDNPARNAAVGQHGEVGLETLLVVDKIHSLIQLCGVWAGVHIDLDRKDRLGDISIGFKILPSFYISRKER